MHKARLPFSASDTFNARPGAHGRADADTTHAHSLATEFAQHRGYKLGYEPISTKLANGSGLILSRCVRHSIGAEHLVPEEMYYTKIAIRVTMMNKM